MSNDECIKFPGYIPRDNIILREIIGEGEFGSVKRGILQTRAGFEVLYSHVPMGKTFNAFH